MDKQATVKIMTSMIRHWERKDEKGCYREFIGLSLEVRRMVEEAFKGAIKKFPTAQARKDAKGIYRLIRKNLDKEATLLTETLGMLLEHWFFSGKETFYMHFSALDKLERTGMLEVLRDEIARFDDAEFRKAAADIPVYIRSREENAAVE